MKRILAVVFGLLLAMATVASARTIVWGSFGVPLTQDNINGVTAACPEDGEPQEGHELTPCQEEWWNDGDPLPGGGGF